MTHTFHPSIIRAYDIRGIYNETLFDLDAFFVGKSFAAFLQKNGKKKNPVLMAHAMKLAIEAGRAAFLAGRMEKKKFASPSSPIIGKIS